MVTAVAAIGGTWVPVSCVRYVTDAGRKLVRIAFSDGRSLLRRSVAWRIAFRSDGWWACAACGYIARGPLGIGAHYCRESRPRLNAWLARAPVWVRLRAERLVRLLAAGEITPEQFRYCVRQVVWCHRCYRQVARSRDANYMRRVRLFFRWEFPPKVDF